MIIRVLRLQRSLGARWLTRSLRLALRSYPESALVEMSAKTRVAAILGAGPGTGAALARAFSAKYEQLSVGPQLMHPRGYTVAVLARSAKTLASNGFML